jgi:hypothetical protein
VCNKNERRTWDYRQHESIKFETSLIYTATLSAVACEGGRQAFNISRNIVHTQIIEDWLAEGIELLPPASMQEVRDCEASVGFLFPDDFVTFYTTACNGFKNWAIDSKSLSLWPLERIRSDYQTGDFIPFSDYLVNASHIGYLKSKNGVFKMNEIWFICDTFTEYLKHWKQETIEYL